MLSRAEINLDAWLPGASSDGGRRRTAFPKAHVGLCCAPAALVPQEAAAGQRRADPSPLMSLFCEPGEKRRAPRSPCGPSPAASLHPLPASLAWSLEANRGPHVRLLIGCLTGQCLKAINGEKHFCPVLSIGLQEKCQPKVMIPCEPGNCCPFQFSHATIYSFHSASEITAGPIISVCADGELQPLQRALLLMPGGGLSSVRSSVLCAEKGEGLPSYVEWLEWLLGTCEESPRGSLGDNGRWRLPRAYSVHTIHFTRTQATAERGISTGFPLIETGDSKQTDGAN